MNTLQLQALKAQAHHLKPIIILGNKGLTEALLDETNIALSTHELIKIKLSGLEREEKMPVVTEICLKINAELIQLVGNIATIYRKNPPKKAASAKKRAKKTIKRTPRQSTTPRAGNRDEKRQPTSKRATSRSAESKDTGSRSAKSRSTEPKSTGARSATSRSTEPKSTGAKRMTSKNIMFKNTTPRRTTRKP